MAADYKNNALGKEISDKMGIFSTNKEILQAVLDEGYENGVWHGVRKGNKYEVKRIPLTIP